MASSLPLDQYIIRNPEFFLGASPEQARIDPDQLLILLDHVRCAAFELPFRQGETFGGEALSELLGYLQEQGVLHREGRSVALDGGQLSGQQRQPALGGGRQLRGDRLPAVAAKQRDRRGRLQRRRR